MQLAPFANCFWFKHWLTRETGTGIITISYKVSMLNYLAKFRFSSQRLFAFGWFFLGYQINRNFLCQCHPSCLSLVVNLNDLRWVQCFFCFHPNFPIFLPSIYNSSSTASLHTLPYYHTFWKAQSSLSSNSSHHIWFRFRTKSPVLWNLPTSKLPFFPPLSSHPSLSYPSTLAYAYFPA